MKFGFNNLDTYNFIIFFRDPTSSGYIRREYLKKRNYKIFIFFEFNNIKTFIFWN